MHKNLFQKYSVFISQCIKTAIYFVDIYKYELDKLGNYQSRFFGFILERMTSVYIKWLKEKYNCNLIYGRLRLFNIQKPLYIH